MLVYFLFEILCLVVTIEIPLHFSQPFTLETAFSQYLDLTSPPSKSLLRVLSLYCDNEVEKTQLLHLASPSGKKDYTDFIQQKPNLLEVILKFPSCRPDIAHLLQILPSLKPRQYSAASFQKRDTAASNANHVRFILSRVEEVQEQKVFRGVCSNWLKNCLVREGYLYDDNEVTITVTPQEQAKLGRPFYIPIFPRPSNSFCLPASLHEHNAIIMIAAGTGIAPFLGFLEQMRIAQLQQTMSKVPRVWKQTLMFYGCTSEQGFICKDEVEQYLDAGTLSKLVPAYSRQQPSDNQEKGGDEDSSCGETGVKVYVQDKVKAYAAELCTLILQEEAIIYVCGLVPFSFPLSQFSLSSTTLPGYLVKSLITYHYTSFIAHFVLYSTDCHSIVSLMNMK